MGIIHYGTAFHGISLRYSSNSSWLRSTLFHTISNPSFSFSVSSSYISTNCHQKIHNTIKQLRIVPPQQFYSCDHSSKNRIVTVHVMFYTIQDLVQINCNMQSVIKEQNISPPDLWSELFARSTP